MPNGDYETSPAEWEAIHCFFDSICRPLTTFASRHRLLIDKYYHDSKDWTFRFRHPFDGVASIAVVYVDATSLSIQARWHVDDYDHGTRSMRWGERATHAIDPAGLLDLLEDALRDTL